MAFNQTIDELIDLTAISPVFGNSYFGNTVSGYIYFIVFFILLLLALKIFKIYLLMIARGISKRTKTKFDDMIIDIVEQIHWPFYLFVALFISSRILRLSSFLDKSFRYILIIVFTYYSIKGLGAIVDFYAGIEIRRRKREDKETDIGFLKLMTGIIKGVLWVIGFLFILSNIGIHITPLIASLGIGGIAIAFALQNILEDLFSSFTIYFDKPFEVGDFIIIGSDLGVVKYIGLKTTRVQTLQGQELIISNRELTSTRINNYKKMEKRRIAFSFGVEYSTSTQKLKKVNDAVTNIIEGIKLATLDRVHFKEFGDFSLNFEVVYYLDSSDYNIYMDTQQEINFKLKDALEKEKIVFAFPSQTIYLKK